LLRVAGAQTRDSHRRQVLATHARLLLADAERTICQPADLAPLQSEGETLLQALGPPDGEKTQFVEYFHSLGIGTARVWLENDQITKLEWEFRAD
jgi:hypothetical protein